MTEAAARRTPGTPCWVSLIVHGLSATQEFYGALFGWEFRPGPDQLGPYVRALLDGKEVAGIGQLPPDRHLPIAWTTYLATDDADLTAEAIGSCGGARSRSGRSTRVRRAGSPSPRTRRGGLGVWQGSEHIGTMTAGVPGTPVWNELVTRET
ncbi:VOC domain-containing protein OS=Streptomyces microflavus OX=1919 GN=Smic_63260 PE=4 SV=1 [Streptomyces microflavus]